jgi:hypothetical protein
MMSEAVVLDCKTCALKDQCAKLFSDDPEMCLKIVRKGN